MKIVRMAAPQHLSELSSRMSNTSLKRNSSIDSLPVELLLHIFDMCDPDIKARLKVTHTCQRWRIISIESPSIWTFVLISASKDDSGDRFNNFMTLLELQLGRTGDLPLDVLWLSSVNENRNGRIMYLIREKAPFSRWRTLTMRVHDFHPHGPLAPLPTDTFTNLEYLSVSKPTNYSIIDTISRTATSRLQVLDLRSSSATPEAITRMYGTLLRKVSKLILPSFHTAVMDAEIPPNISHLEADVRHKHLFPHITHYKLTICVLITTDALLPKLTHLTVTSSLDVNPGCEVMLPCLKTLRCATIRLSSNATLMAPMLETLHFCASYSSAVNEIRTSSVERTLQHPGYRLSPKRLLEIELCMTERSTLAALELSPHVKEVMLTFDNRASARSILEKALTSVSNVDRPAGEGPVASIGPQVKELRLKFKWPFQNLDIWKTRSGVALWPFGKRWFTPSLNLTFDPHAILTSAQLVRLRNFQSRTASTTAQGVSFADRNHHNPEQPTISFPTESLDSSSARKRDLLASRLADSKHSVASKIGKGRNRVMAASGVGPYLAKKKQEKGGSGDDQPEWEMEGIRVPRELIQGTVMKKLSGKGKATKERLFRLDANQGRMYWNSRRRGVIYLENVKELRPGSAAHSEIRAILPNTDISKVEDQWLTIIYTHEDSYKTLNVIAPTTELLTKWFDTLTKIRQLRVDFMGGILHSGSSVGNELWERHHFAGADVSKDDLLSYREVKTLCWRLNFGGTEAELKKRFMESAKDHLITNSLTHDEFRDFVRRLKERPDIAKVFETTRAGKDFNFSVFEDFMKNCQKSRLSTEELESLYRLFCPSAAADAVPSVGTAPPNTDASTTKPIDKLPPWTLESFSQFLHSGYNSGFTDSIATVPSGSSPSTTQDSKVYQDMTQPLSSYYISSSHNTYLVGNQLVGSSSVEGYVRSLLGGCRSVEMDIYDGPHGGYGGLGVTMSNSLSTEVGNIRDEVVHEATELENALVAVTAAEQEVKVDGATAADLKVAMTQSGVILGEPIVTHGGTLTSSLSVRRICEAIDRYAFVSSQYPVIISGEIHCGIEQQKVLVRIMTEVFGDKLVVAPVDLDDVDVVLPSPEQLKGRILLKAKNKFLETKVQSTMPEGLPADEEEVENQKAARRPSMSGSGHSEGRNIKEKAKGMMGKLVGLVHRRSNSISSAKKGGKKGASSGSGRSTPPAKETATHDLHPPSTVDATTTPTTATGTTAHPSSSANPPPSLEVEAPTGEKKPVDVASPSDPPPGQSLAKPAMAPELLPLLIYTSGVTYRGLGPDRGYAPSQVFSLSETRAKSLIHNPKQANVKDSLKSSAKDSALLVAHTRGHLVRVYPKGTRVDSSNYEPNVFWAMGCQLVTQNWQTVDRGWHMNRAMFLRNGGAGYLLKPPALLDPAYPSDLKKHPHTKHVLRIRVISAQQLPRPKDHQGYEVIDQSTVDPYVKVTIHIPIWASGQSSESIAPIAVGPMSSKEEAEAQPGEVQSSSHREEGLLAEAGAAGDEQAGAAVGERVVKVRTRTIRNNGFNPVWDDELRLPFDVFGEGMKDLVFVRFLIKDDNEMEKDGFVGGYSTSLGSLEMGYRHLPLYDEQVSQILFAGLFVHLSIEDL